MELVELRLTQYLRMLAVAALVFVISSYALPVFASDVASEEESRANCENGCKEAKDSKKTRSGKKGDKKTRVGKARPDLDKLVKDGIINKETSEKIDKFLKERYDKRVEEKQKLKEMTPEEREKYFESKHKKPRADIWTDMVNAGIITSSEAEAIKASIKESRPEEVNPEAKAD
jgi:hypothetical protein